MKRRVDLALVGHAYAPGGEPVAELTARLRVGDFFKTLEIKGDRLWTEGPEGLVASAPIPFARMPLRYERAPLGPTTRSASTSMRPRARRPGAGQPRARRRASPAPIVATTSQQRTRRPLQHPARDAARARRRLRPPSPPTWRPRRKLLDEAGLFWAYGVAAASSGLGPAPAGFNFEFFNTSPRDQQIDMLRAGAVIELENLSPTHPRLTTQLPAIRPQVFRIDPKSGRAEEIILRCDTLWIDTDRGVAVLTFRGLHDVGAGARTPSASWWSPPIRRARSSASIASSRCCASSAREPRPARPSSATTSSNDPLALRYDTVKAARTSAAPAAPSPIALAKAKVEPTQRFDWQTGFAPKPQRRAPRPTPKSTTIARATSRKCRGAKPRSPSGPGPGLVARAARGHRGVRLGPDGARAQGGPPSLPRHRRRCCRLRRRSSRSHRRRRCPRPSSRRR